MFSLNGKTFYGTLAYLDKVIEEDCVLPVLSSYLVVPEEGCIRIVASDTETTISARIPATTKEDNAAFLIEAKRFTKAVREMPDEVIEFEVRNDSLDYKWSTGSGTIGIVTDTEAYPRDEDGGKVGAFTVSARKLSCGLGHVMYAMNKDDLRPITNGVHFDVFPGRLSVVATNARMMALEEIAEEKFSEDFGFTVGRKPASILKKVLSKASSLDVDVFCGEKNARFSVGGFVIGIRLLEGKFPNYRSVIPRPDADMDTEVCIGKGDFLSMLRRVEVCSDSLTNYVDVIISDGRITVEGRDLAASASADDSMECSCFGAGRKARFMAKRLIAALENFPGEEVRLLFRGTPETDVAMMLTLRRNEDKTEEDGSESIAVVMAVSMDS